MADVRIKIAKQLRELLELLETTDPSVRNDALDAQVLRPGLETITAQLEAGLVPGPTPEDVRAALVKEGVPPNGAEYVLRVLAKLGVL